MRSRMNQALQSSPQGGLEESGRVNELVENYVKKNTELYDIETLIPVSKHLLSNQLWPVSQTQIQIETKCTVRKSVELTVSQSVTFLFLE